MIGLRQEFARKAIHLTSASVPLAYAAGAPRAFLAEGLCLLFAVALLVEVGRARVPAVRRRFEGLTGSLLRAHERHRWAGATWMLLAFALAVVLLPRAVAIAAMWAVAVGDASAAIVGRTLGRARERSRARALSDGAQEGAPEGRAGGGVDAASESSVSAPPGGKSMAGSLACLVTTALGALLVAELSPLLALVAGVAAAIAERPSWRLDDNLRVVAAVGGAVLLVGRVVPQPPS